jgi:peptidoglycan/LPS O-acetylase OafA/YrhL
MARKRSVSATPERPVRAVSATPERPVLAQRATLGKAGAVATMVTTPAASPRLPPLLDTRPLTGLRVLLNLWIMVFHALFMIVYFVEEEIESLFHRIPIIEHGYLAVDGFFVLSGFLLALPWVMEAEEEEAGGKRAKAAEKNPSPPPSAWARIHASWRGRFLRIIPAYALLVFLHCFVVSPCGTYPKTAVRMPPARAIFDLFFPAADAWVDNGCGGWWANALHVPFLLPFNGAFMHSWSLGVQYQMWLWAPVAWFLLDLGKGERLRLAAGGTALAAVVFRSVAQLHSSTPGIVKGSITGSALDLFWYSQPLARAHVMVAGMWTAQLAVRVALKRRRKGVEGAKTAEPSAAAAVTTAPSTFSLPLPDAVLVLLVAAFVWVNMGWADLMGGEDARYTRGLAHNLFIALLQVGTPLSSLVWCLLVLSLLFPPSRVSAAVASALSSERFGLPADLSLHTFLLHPMVMTLAYSRPAFLYPPSALDQLPAAAEGGLLDATWAPLRPVVALWFAVREAAAPSGHPLTYAAMMGLQAGVSILVTYLLAWAGMVLWERPLVAFLRRRLAAGHGASSPSLLHRGLVAYSWLVIAVGVISIPLVVGVVVLYAGPETEGWIRTTFGKAAAAAGTEA